MSKGRVCSVLWWGRFDPDYSRNRILRRLFSELDWQLVDFYPHFSPLGDAEASLRGMPKVDLIWLPCFRQRDVAAASRWGRARGIPLLFDPLISAYDKKVDERGKLGVSSRAARRLLEWEREIFARADWVVADTLAHADYFSQILGVPREKIIVIYVGAEMALFQPAPMPRAGTNDVPEVLFYGSFIPLQGPEVVVEAARRYEGPPVRWTMLGNGPLRKRCEVGAAGLPNFAFEDWLDYTSLPGRIHRASVLLGVFGTTPKADRVIPNKVYQSLACARPVITRRALAYPPELTIMDRSGLVWVPPGDPGTLANSVTALLTDRLTLVDLGKNAFETVRRFFSEDVLRQQLNDLLKLVRGC